MAVFKNGHKFFDTPSLWLFQPTEYSRETFVAESEKAMQLPSGSFGHAHCLVAPHQDTLAWNRAATLWEIQATKNSHVPVLCLTVPAELSLWVTPAQASDIWRRVKKPQVMLATTLKSPPGIQVSYRRPQASWTRDTPFLLCLGWISRICEHKEMVIFLHY